MYHYQHESGAIVSSVRPKTSKEYESLKLPLYTEPKLPELPKLNEWQLKVVSTIGLSVEEKARMAKLPIKIIEQYLNKC